MWGFWRLWKTIWQASCMRGLWHDLEYLLKWFWTMAHNLQAMLSNKLAITNHIIITYKLTTDRLVEHMNNVLHNILSKEMVVCENLHNWKKGISCNLGGEFHVQVIHGIHPISTCTWVEIGVTFQSKIMITFCMLEWHQSRMEEF